MSPHVLELLKSGVSAGPDGFFPTNISCSIHVRFHHGFPWASARRTVRVILIEITVFRLEEKKTAECVDGIHLQYEGLKKCKMVSVFT